MSEFSNALSRLIQEKNIQVYSMVKYCGLDRSTMYKIISGKRKPPSEQTFNKIAEYMQLTPSEYENFKTAYKITLMGPKLYYQRKGVLEFLCDFPDKNTIPTPILSEQSGLMQTDDDIDKTTSIFTSDAKFNQILQHILSKEHGKKNGKIALFLQPDYDFLFNFLANLKLSDTPVQIEHIICLSKAQKMTSTNESYNLLYLKKLIPLYIRNLNYHPYYFYDDIESHYFNYNVFSCMILTTEYAVLCTSDYKTGMLYHDSQIVSMLWKLYYSYQDKCSPLFETVSAVVEDCNRFDLIEWKRQPGFMLQTDPFLIPLISGDLLKKLVPENLSHYDVIFPFFEKFIENRARCLTCNDICFYNTKQGLTQFAKTGKLSEIPAGACKPIEIEDRIDLLKKLLNCIKKSQNFRILRKPLDSIPANFHMSVNENSGFLMFTNIRNKNVYLIFQESSMLSTFLDYTAWLDEKNNLCTQEESIRYVETTIEALENGTIDCL